MNISKELVARSLLNFRSKNHLTQRQLSEKLFVSERQIKRWEAAKTLPNHLSTKALIEAKILIINAD